MSGCPVQPGPAGRVEGALGTGCSNMSVSDVTLHLPGSDRMLQEPETLQKHNLSYLNIPLNEDPVEFFLKIFQLSET